MGSKQRRVGGVKGHVGSRGEGQGGQGWGGLGGGRLGRGTMAVAGVGVGSSSCFPSFSGVWGTRLLVQELGGFGVIGCRLGGGDLPGAACGHHRIGGDLGEAVLGRRPLGGWWVTTVMEGDLQPRGFLGENLVVVTSGTRS